MLSNFPIDLETNNVSHFDVRKMSHRTSNMTERLRPCGCCDGFEQTPIFKRSDVAHWLQNVSSNLVGVMQ